MELTSVDARPTESVATLSLGATSKLPIGEDDETSVARTDQGDMNGVFERLRLVFTL